MISSRLENQTEVTSTKCFKHQWHLQVKQINMNYMIISSCMPLQSFSHWHHIWHTLQYVEATLMTRAACVPPCWNERKSSCNLCSCAEMLVSLQNRWNQRKSKVLSRVELRWTPKVFLLHSNCCDTFTHPMQSTHLYAMLQEYHYSTAKIINKWRTPSSNRFANCPSNRGQPKTSKNSNYWSYCTLQWTWGEGHLETNIWFWSGVFKYMPSMPCGGTCTSKARRSRSRPPPCLCVIRVHHE